MYFPILKGIQICIAGNRFAEFAELIYFTKTLSISVVLSILVDLIIYAHHWLMVLNCTKWNLKI